MTDKFYEDIYNEMISEGGLKRHYAILFLFVAICFPFHILKIKIKSRLHKK